MVRCGVGSLVLFTIRSIKHSIVFHAMEKCLSGDALRMRASCSELYCIIFINSAFIRTKQNISEPWDRNQLHTILVKSAVPYQMYRLKLVSL